MREIKQLKDEEAITQQIQHSKCIKLNFHMIVHTGGKPKYNRVGSEDSQDSAFRSPSLQFNQKFSKTNLKE
jgi:hypothetical protein